MRELYLSLANDIIENISDMEARKEAFDDLITKLFYDNSIDNGSYETIAYLISDIASDAGIDIEF